MVALGFGVLWLGYQQVIYGWVLLKGWDIRWRDLANPVHPYQWPRAGQPRAGQPPPTVPQGQILPGQTASSTTAQGGTSSSSAPPASSYD